MEKVETKVTPRSGVGYDLCDKRLHDISGQFLSFYMINSRMPKTLDELKKTPIGKMPPLACPVSSKAYRYAPKGLKIKGRSGLLVLFDSEASHEKMRWGIMIYLQGGGKPITTKVLLLRDGDVVDAMGSQIQ